MHFVASGAREGRSTTFDGLEYIASYGDLIATFGPNEHDGATHFIANGYREGRSVAFDGLDYIASYGDLIRAFGAEADAGSVHFITNGFTEKAGDRTLFDAEQYLANYRDLQRGVRQRRGSRDAALHHQRLRRGPNRSILVRRPRPIS